MKMLEFGRTLQMVNFLQTRTPLVKKIIKLMFGTLAYPESMRNSEVDWLSLPNDITCYICIKLLSIKDYIIFGATCKSWQSIYIDVLARHARPLQTQLPFLMLCPPEFRSNRDDFDYNHHTRRLYRVDENRLLGNFQISLAHHVSCTNSSHGWLIKVSPDHQVSLLNLLRSTNNEIQLAPVKGDGFNYCLVKVVLSANPASTPKFVAMAIHNNHGQYFRRLAFFRPGDNAWTLLHYEGQIQDIIFCRDRFYALDDNGIVSVWDMNDAHPTMERVLQVAQSIPTKSEYSSSKGYIVESSGNLLQVIRNIKYVNNIEPFLVIRHYFTSEFCIFKLDENRGEWIQTDNLQGCALFLGHNSSLSLLASDFPKCRPNSIYFTDDNLTEYALRAHLGIGPYDMGIFDVKDGTIKPHYPNESIMLTSIPPPIWIEPMPAYTTAVVADMVSE
ncbi:hypothetical protein AQUCO_01600075v1 [Aquilegia coerulea]|uniref:KIB1-4 beta-propeller domain-containing protein n=1 Tax=Aquilegia coerulea TaxID=218851 RepID=A0A2G5DQ33_AQUCA|nr:hypothetical protein AQUCO_01600075v1 [Aquilegia coerulea]